jgi:osmotically inducible lipoprotein OsmB
MMNTKSKFVKVCRYIVGAAAIATTVSLAGCYGPPMGPRGTDTLIGGAVGAGGGALVGSAVGSPLAGAALGGLAGAGAGYLIGNSQSHYYRYGGY